MPKHAFMSPKAISNRIKAKGLQKLKWYCQMCEKQCRDENGFKCHKMSESHARQMKLFIQNPGRFMSEFSREFEKGFMQILRLRGGRRVKANDVYQDYISDRNHRHMNATMWSTLTGFVLYLGKTGKATIERAENEGNGRGWYITYIERDPDIIARQNRVKKMIKIEKREREREQNQIREIVLNNKKLNKLNKNKYKPTELHANHKNDHKITFGFKAKPKILDDIDNHGDPDDQDTDLKDDKNDKNVKKQSNINRKRKLNNISSLIHENEHKKRKLNSKYSTWLSKGIIVKIKHCDYLNRKGEVIDVIFRNNKCRAIVKLLKCADGIELTLSSKYLETVIPSFNKKIKILNGKYKSCVGILKSINKHKQCGNIELVTDNNRRKNISLPYDDFSKFVSQ